MTLFNKKVKTPDTCTYCSKEAERNPCYSMEPNGRGLYCTREDGHSGEHIACSLKEHIIARWKNKNGDNHE